MTKREKVIRGLGACKPISLFGRDCENCPYYDEEDADDLPFGVCNIQDMLNDALELLKEQEPRVMTWNEILRSSEIESPPVWLEDNDKIHVVPALVIGSLLTLQNGAITFILRGKRIGANKSDYGTRWRAWTSRPSPEQMRDTPWEGTENG